MLTESAAGRREHLPAHVYTRPAITTSHLSREITRARPSTNQSRLDRAVYGCTRDRDLATTIAEMFTVDRPSPGRMRLPEDRACVIACWTARADRPIHQRRRQKSGDRSVASVLVAGIYLHCRCRDLARRRRVECQFGITRLLRPLSVAGCRRAAPARLCARRWMPRNAARRVGSAGRRRAGVTAPTAASVAISPASYLSTWTRNAAESPAARCHIVVMYNIYDARYNRLHA